MAQNLPKNVHVSRHPCLQVKLSQLRSGKASSRETNDLVHEIATIIGCEAFAENISVAPGEKVRCSLPSPLPPSLNSSRY